MPDLSPLLLIPGLGCTAELYSGQAAAFGDDPPTAIADVTGANTIAGLARQVLDRAPPRFAVAGLSMGGYICFELWRQAPERIAKLALLDTQARPDGPPASDVRMRMIQLASEGRLDKVHEALYPRLVAPRRRDDAALETVVRRMLMEVGAPAFVRQQNAILRRADSRPTLPTISVPTLVLVGADDQLTPPDLSEEMARAIPNADLVIVPGVGHLAPLEQPEAVTQALRRWLAR